jgi:hypothetical protein
VRYQESRPYLEITFPEHLQMMNNYSRAITRFPSFDIERTRPLDYEVLLAIRSAVSNRHDQKQLMHAARRTRLSMMAKLGITRSRNPGFLDINTSIDEISTFGSFDFSTYIASQNEPDTPAQSSSSVAKSSTSSMSKHDPQGQLPVIEVDDQDIQALNAPADLEAAVASLNQLVAASTEPQATVEQQKIPSIVQQTPEEPKKYDNAPKSPITATSAVLQDPAASSAPKPEVPPISQATPSSLTKSAEVGNSNPISDSTPVANPVAAAPGSVVSELLSKIKPEDLLSMLRSFSDSNLSIQSVCIFILTF